MRFFETGLSFVGKDVSELIQTPSLAMVAVGDVLDKQNHPSRAYDFFDLKHDVESLLPANLNPAHLCYERADLAFLHKGQSAHILINGQKIGWLGQLHPSIAKTLDLPTVWVAQLDSDQLLDQHKNHKPILPPSKFPSVRRDLAFLVAQDISWQTLALDVRQAVGDYLYDLWLFDVYQGEHLPDGKKSLAFAMILQNHTATLDDDTIKSLMDAVIDRLTQKHHAQLRDS